MPRVSILIPSYNHSAFLPACLKSVQDQTYTDYEVIVFDDGSQDESLDVLSDFASQDPRFQVHVNAQNLGTYGTLEKALRSASGEFVAILNSDDLWANDKLERQVAELAGQQDCSACYTLGWMVDGEGRIDQNSDVHDSWSTERIQDLLPYLLYENRVLASSVLFRREGLRFDPSLRYSGDWVALIEASSRGSFVCIGDRLTLWRQHGHNSYRLSPRQAQEEVRVRRAIMTSSSGWIKDRPRSLWRNSEGLNALNLFALYILFGKAADARALLPAMLKYRDPLFALKRWAALGLGTGRLRDHLWRDHAPPKTRYERFEARLLDHLPPLDFKMAES